MMLRPRWILALLLALGIAAAFALLGQWQLERAIASGEVVQRETETVMPLARVVQPDAATPQAATGQMVSVNGFFLPGDEQLVTDRFNGGTSGVWVISRFVSVDSANLAVARGWAPDEQAGCDVIEALSTSAQNAPVTVTGRFLPAEAPEVPAEGSDPHSMSTVSPAALINLWTGFTDQPVYSGYVVDAVPPAGLSAIDSPVPEEEVSLNWLNVFYAVEWIVFAGFAVFLWYRLVRDAYEREQEVAALAAALPPA